MAKMRECQKNEMVRRERERERERGTERVGNCVWSKKCPSKLCLV